MQGCRKLYMLYVKAPNGQTMHILLVHCIDQKKKFFLFTVATFMNGFVGIQTLECCLLILEVFWNKCAKHGFFWIMHC